jgi:hypothetical protein
MEIMFMDHQKAPREVFVTCKVCINREDSKAFTYFKIFTTNRSTYPIGRIYAVFSQTVLCLELLGKPKQ